MAQDPSELVFTLDKLYLLKKDGSAITLDVIIGNKQSPLLDVKLNSKVLLTDHDKSVKDLDIGIDKTLSKKILSVVGVVSDTADDSDKIQVIIRVKGGLSEINKKFMVTVEEQGEQVDIDFNIRFK